MRQIDLSDYTREATQAAANALMDAEASAVVNAGHYERSHTRTAYRNGYRTRDWETAHGTVTLHIPKLRRGSYYPAFLDDARAGAAFGRAAWAALLTEMQSDDVLPLLTTPDDGVAKRVCKALNRTAQRYLTRRLRHRYPVLFIDRHAGYVLVYGQRLDGAVELLDVQPDAQDAGAAGWRQIVRGWVQRGLTGVEQIAGGAVTDAAGRAVREAFPEAVLANHDEPQIVAALGLPLPQPAVDRGYPQALRQTATDSTLSLVVRGDTLITLRRMLRDERDAVGEVTLPAA